MADGKYLAEDTGEIKEEQAPNVSADASGAGKQATGFEPTNPIEKV